MWASGWGRANGAGAMRRSGGERMRVGLAVLSAASGLGLLCAPRAAGMMLGLPARSRLCRVLGLRDVALGLLMFSERSRWGLAGRAASDVVDAVIIAREARRRARNGTASRLAVATLSAVSAAALAARRRS